MKKLTAIILSIVMIITCAAPAFASESMTKGLLVQDYNMLSDAQELGVQEIIYNITSANWNSQKGGIDWLINEMNQRGFKVTIVILKSIQGDGAIGANYAMFDTSDAALFSDIASTLGTKVGRYIIGNEVNNQQWNYAGNMDCISYCQKYAEAFKTAYNSIKAANSQAEVYIPFDYGWYNESNNTNKYSGREMLMRLNGMLPKDMDWGVAWHPYPDPVGDPNFTDDAIATDDTYSNIVNFKNLHVLTDYMQTDEMRKADGSVRNIILSEQGFSSLQNGVVNEAAQAEYFKQSWAIAKANPYIKAYLLSRQVDSRSEKNQGWAFGLWNNDMNAAQDDKATTKKAIWEVFKNINTASGSEGVVLVGPGM